MKLMNSSVIKAINEALYFSTNKKYEKPEIKPWQYVQMEYERVGITPPVQMPLFETIDDAQIWTCLDGNYNARLREVAWPVAG